MKKTAPWARLEAEYDTGFDRTVPARFRFIGVPLCLSPAAAKAAQQVANALVGSVVDEICAGTATGRKVVATHDYKTVSAASGPIDPNQYSDLCREYAQYKNAAPKSP